MPIWLVFALGALFGMFVMPMIMGLVKRPQAQQG